MPEEGLPAGRGSCSGRLRSPRARRACCRRGYPPVDLAAVDRLMSDELAAASIPGAAIAITRGDQVLHVRGYGHDADDVPITEDTLSASLR